MSLLTSSRAFASSRGASIRASRSISSAGYESQVSAARENVLHHLETHDRSNYLLSKYIPEPSRDAFLAIKGFALEVSRISMSTTARSSQASAQLRNTLGISTSAIKFKFWSDQLSDVFADPDSDRAIGEPITFLIRDALRNGINLDISKFHQYLQTRKLFYETKKFRSTADICAYGEGTYSQLNYLVQGALLSDHISPSAVTLLEYSPKLQSLVSDIVAHLGQATAVGAMILGTKYYGEQNVVTLPEDIMSSKNVSQEEVLRFAQGHEIDAGLRDKLKDVIYETAITANDHILTARQKLQQVKELIPQVVQEHRHDELLNRFHRKWRRGVPDVIFVPFMAGIPTTLYLQKLESADFDLMNPNLAKKEWRLPWRSYWDYSLRRV